MKTIALQDNFSKVKAVEEVYQQMLRFPGDVQQAMAGELRRQRRVNKRRVIQSEKSDTEKMKAEKRARADLESPVRGRMDAEEGEFELNERQCCIDFRV